MLGTELWENKFDRLTMLQMCGEYENINYMIMTQDLINFVLSFHVGTWLYVRYVSKRMQQTRHSGI